MIAPVTTLFPVLAVLAAIVAYLVPEPFAALRPAIPYLLGVVMFGMGITLTAGNFAEVLRRPGTVGAGVAMQYLWMPLVAWALAVGLDLPPALLAGMVLVGASPGGTASNVVCYLARGDVALSITLTAVSTLLAVAATPYLTLLYAGRYLEVPAAAMLWDVAWIVLIPVAAGVAVNHLFGRRLARIKHYFPAVSVTAIVLIIAVVVALGHDSLGTVGLLLALAVVLHNALGLAGGYALGALLGRPHKVRIALAIEVGMQNSGLAVALALKHFSPLAALPGALFSVWHNVTGAALAAHWVRRVKRS